MKIGLEEAQHNLLKNRGNHGTHQIKPIDLSTLHLEAVRKKKKEPTKNESNDAMTNLCTSFSVLDIIFGKLLC